MKARNAFAPARLAGVVTPARIARLGALVLFVILATANSGGYRYGVGDQAFYQPATALRLDPGLFPRDRTLIESQARLTIIDETLAAASRVTRLELPKLFLAIYLVTLIATFFASAQLARAVGLSETATAVFLLLLTLRHRIAKTGANTLEGYMHPRQLAFALGIFAFTASFRRRWPLMLLCWAAAAAIHPTTAMWWAIAIAAGLILTTSARQRVFMAASLAIFLIGAVMAPMIAGAAGLPAMDDQWLAVLENKDYLFASGWPAYAWMLNLAYLPLIILLSRIKGDARFVAPAIALFAAFACAHPFIETHVSLAVQLQVSRVFWLLDFLLMLLVAWILLDWPRRSHVARRAAVAAVLLFAIGRGVYTLQQAVDSRSIVQITLPADDWTDAMAWLRTQPADWLILAHPDHAWLYGTSVRVAANRDVIVESVKDSAISMYDRDVAMRTAERLAALVTFGAMTSQDAMALGQRYGAAVAVTENTRPLDLPVLHRNFTFTVYDLRGSSRNQ